MKYTTEDIRRFWSRVDIGPSLADCWQWKLKPNQYGYGRFTTLGDSSRNQYLAHRFSYAVSKGFVPISALVRHSCDNRLCVNPAHLLLGDHGQNSQDMLARHRHPSQHQTHCLRGHEFTEENTYQPLNRGGRWCRKCSVIRSANYLIRKRLSKVVV